MRSIPVFALLILSVSLSAAVPYSFSAGSQAKASEVNANFATIDSALQKKASLDAVNSKLKLDSAALAKTVLDSAASLRKAIPNAAILATKIDTSAFNPVSRQVQSLATSKQNALGFTPVNRAGDEMLGALAVAGGRISLTNYDSNQVTFGFRGIGAPIMNGHTRGAKAIWFDNADLAYTDYATGIDNYTLWNSIPAATSAFAFKWYAGTTQVMKLDGTGALSVAGLVTTGKIVTNGISASNVADYVFEPGYTLTSLSDIEAYTTEHKHLPEVPSAIEIEKGGLDLAQMNLILLKKVEELTLHAIAQQKEIEAQKAAFEARIQRLESAGR